MRHLAIGDIHGCRAALETLLDFVSPEPDDVLVTLGDYVDRGPDSRGVLELLIEWDRRERLVALRGNHEVMMLAARHNAALVGPWLAVGGNETLRSYGVGGRLAALDEIPADHWAFLEERLCSFYEIDAHIFVHGSVAPELPLEEQPDYMLYWTMFDAATSHDSGKTVVCGHASQHSGLPAQVSNAVVCLDTWACGAGWLTCLSVETGQYWQANQAGETRQARLAP